MASQHSRRTGSVTWLRTSGRQDHLKPWQRWEEKPALWDNIPSFPESPPQHTFELSSMVFTWVLIPNSGKCSYSLVFASVFSLGCWPEPSLLQVLWTTLLFLFKKSPPLSGGYLPPNNWPLCPCASLQKENDFVCSFFSPPGWDLQLACPGVFLSDAYRIFIALQNR